MKFIFLCLLLEPLFSNAQLPVITKDPTQFDRFVEKAKIEWATYFTDTVRFTEKNLSEILRTRFDKKEISASVPVVARTAASNKIVYSSKEEILSAYPSIRNQTPAQYFDSLTNDLAEAVQILYIEKGMLKTYVPWVSTKFSVITASGIRLGYADYFSTAFNFKYNSSQSSSHKTISLGQTKKKIIIEPASSKVMLKQLYGKNMIEMLWPSLLEDRFDIFSADGSKKLAGTSLINGIKGDSVSIPVYDSTGALINNKTMFAEPILPEQISSAELTQNWFYDLSKNIVYNTLTDIILLASPLKTGETDATALPVLKIVFK